MGIFLVVLFFLAAGGATKAGVFLLSEDELIRVRSCSIFGHQLSQSCGFESQSRDWADSIIRECPCSRDRHCILQEVAKS
jgi:hypothetical protein